MAKNYRSELVGVFGNPVDENPTGVIEEAAFAATNLDYRYLTIKVEPSGLETAMKSVRIMHMRGINLTIPHKVECLKYLDELSPAAEIIGAVNVVVNNDGRLWGDNTDGKGLLEALSANGVDVAGKKITMLGAGGAARAICVEAALAGAESITVINRDETKGSQLVSLINEKTQAKGYYQKWQPGMPIPQGTEILINGTSVGLYPNVNEKPDVDYDTVTSDMVVTDVVFNDPNTLFLAEAKKRGAQTIDGLGMLVNQAAVNFKHWTGIDAPKDIMTKVLKGEFGL